MRPLGAEAEHSDIQSYGLVYAGRLGLRGSGPRCAPPPLPSLVHFPVPPPTASPLGKGSSPGATGPRLGAMTCFPSSPCPAIADCACRRRPAPRFPALSSRFPSPHLHYPVARSGLGSDTSKATPTRDAGPTLERGRCNAMQHPGQAAYVLSLASGELARGPHQLSDDVLCADHRNCWSERPFRLSICRGFSVFHLSCTMYSTLSALEAIGTSSVFHITCSRILDLLVLYQNLDFPESECLKSKGTLKACRRF